MIRAEYQDPTIDVMLTVKVWQHSVTLGDGHGSIDLDGRTPDEALSQEISNARSQARWWEARIARLDAARAALEAL